MSEYTDRLVQQTEAMLHFRHDETLTETSPERLHEALSDVIMMEINDRWSRTRHTQQNGRRAYYFSAEYLIGRLIYSNLFNLGILDDIKESFAAKGVDLACLEDIEDAALGNGGPRPSGRLLPRQRRYARPAPHGLRPALSLRPVQADV